MYNITMHCFLFNTCSFIYDMFFYQACNKVECFHCSVFFVIEVIYVHNAIIKEVFSNEKPLLFL